MDFLIADTFTDSLARLTGEEQKAVKTAAFDLQLNQVSAGASLHKLDHAKDKNFWSARVSSDLRLIVHRTAQSLLLCYVDHHAQAYRWAERRKLETHPKTGAAQLVEIREQVQEIIVPKYVEVAQPKPPLFHKLADDVLLGYGVPREWLKDVREVNEDSILALADHLPAEAADALLELATGGKPRILTATLSQPPIQGRQQPQAQQQLPAADPFTHPDAQRRFRLISDAEELERALDYPWDKWIVFLHPAQQELVERDFNGPARVAGSAGTGKTVVALHRAVHLARSQPEGRVLLTTFSPTLANALRQKLNRLISNTPSLAERLEVHDVNGIGLRLYERYFGKARLASNETVAALIGEAAAGQKLSRNFLLTEWEELVDAWQLDSWERYRDVKRLGRKTRLSEAQRAAAWSVFDQVRALLAADGQITLSGMFSRLAARVSEQNHPPFDFVVVDEAQDVGVAQLRFLAALGGERPNGLFFAGDLGQRIFQTAFSWKSVGVDVRGRSRTLHVNYRTSHQIREQADRLLAPELADVDGVNEDRRGTVSVFNGPAPRIETFTSQEEEISAVAAWLAERSKNGVAAHEIGLFVRTENELPRASAAVHQAGLAYHVLTDQMETITGQVSLSPMHLAKGLEFRAVAVMACDDEVIPLQSRIETASDESDLEEVYNTERQLLYVACTRARDQLLVTSVEPASEFLDDMRTNNPHSREDTIMPASKKSQPSSKKSAPSGQNVSANPAGPSVGAPYIGQEMRRIDLGHGKTLRISKGNLTRATTDAIVNAANENLQLGSGIAGAILKYGGQIIQDECDAWIREHGKAGPRKPAVTSAGALPARYVIHGVAPVWHDGMHGEKQDILDAYNSVLDKAAELRIATIAIPSLGTGIFGIPKNVGANAAMTAVKRFAAERLDSSITDVYLMNNDDLTVESMRAAAAQHFGEAP